MVLAVNWVGVSVDLRQAVTVIVGAIGVLSALVTWWALPDWKCLRIFLEQAGDLPTALDAFPELAMLMMPCIIAAI